LLKFSAKLEFICKSRNFWIDFYLGQLFDFVESYFLKIIRAASPPSVPNLFAYVFPATKKDFHSSRAAGFGFPIGIIIIRN